MLSKRTKHILATLTLSTLPFSGQALDHFDNVQFMSAMVRDHQIEDPNAMELSDVRLMGLINVVGQPYSIENNALFKRASETSAFWGDPGLMRIQYRPEVKDANGETLFHLGRTENLGDNHFDFAHAEKRKEAGRAMVRTLESMDSEWIMFDEPTWGYRGLENARDLPISQALNEAVIAITGRPINSVDAYLDDPELWHAFVYVRQRALAESLTHWSEVIREQAKKPTINIIPSGLESGAMAGFEIATAMDVFDDSIDLIQIDPYYTLFVEDTRYPSFILRMLDEHTPRDMPILGWVDGVNALLERLGIKNPPPESMKPQIASYLANGSDHIAVWAYSYLESMNNREAYQDMVKWVRANQALFRGNPEMYSNTAIYFSNVTFAMNDFFAQGWSHGTGPFGQYFTVLNTYYMATANQVPVRVLSTPFGHEDRLSGMLSGLDRLIIADAIVMTDDEIDAIREWVKNGGVLINIGTSGILDEYRNERPEGLAGIVDIAMTPVRPRSEITFTNSWPDDNGVRAVSLNGSNETLFIERYQSNLNYAMNSGDERAQYYPDRWPLHLRDEPLVQTRRLPRPQVEDWLPAGSVGLIANDHADVLARFDNGEAAVVSKTLGQGRVIQIAPTDWLTRYRNPVARETARILFYQVTEPEIQLSSRNGDDLGSVELVVTERNAHLNRALITHLIRHVHDDQAILPDDAPLQNLLLEIPLQSNEAVNFVQGFSPDNSPVELEYTRNGDMLEIELKELDVYTAIMVGTNASLE